MRSVEGVQSYGVLLPLRRGEFAAHRFETGTPAFLVDLRFERRVPSASLDDMVSADHIGTEGAAVPDRLPDLELPAFETADAMVAALTAIDLRRCCE